MVLKRFLKHSIKLGSKYHYESWFDEAGIYQIVLPENELYYSDDKKWIIIGGPGIDSIKFCVKADQSDSRVYAYYPIDDEYIPVADNIKDLIVNYKSGKLTL